MDVVVKVRKSNPQLKTPTYKTEGSAGFDFASSVDATLLPGESKLIPTGLYFEIPQGYEVQVRPRSGLALDHSIIVLNSPGTIDSDYRGEVKIILGNLGGENFYINAGDRIAQGVLKVVERAKFVEVEELQETERGEGGFGSTGKT